MGRTFERNASGAQSRVARPVLVLVVLVDPDDRVGPKRRKMPKERKNSVEIRYRRKQVDTILLAEVL